MKGKIINMNLNTILQILKKIEKANMLDRETIFNNFRAMDNDDLKLLILPGEKFFWQSASEVIQNLHSNQIVSLLPQILTWLQDVNWPGAFTVIETLQSLGKDCILPYLEETLIRAKKEEDYMWIGGINMLIEELQLSENDFSSSDIFDILKLSDF